MGFIKWLGDNERVIAEAIGHLAIGATLVIRMLPNRANNKAIDWVLEVLDRLSMQKDRRS
jgi:hypothetical protein